MVVTLNFKHVEESVIVKQLLAVHVDGVYRKVQVFPMHRSTAHSKLNARPICSHGGGGQNDGLLFVDTQFEMTQKACVVVKESDMGRSRRRQIALARAGEKRTSADQCQLLSVEQ